MRDVDCHQTEQEDDQRHPPGQGNRHQQLAEEDGSVRQTGSQQRLQRVPFTLSGNRVGDGDAYRDVVAIALATALRDIVDVLLMQKEVSIEGGWADLEMPVRIENVRDFKLWDSWQNDYCIRCILVETKNLRMAAQYEHVNQLMGYLRDGDRGRFGFLVSRNGFTKKARVTLSRIAKERRHLVLPLSTS